MRMLWTKTVIVAAAAAASLGMAAPAEAQRYWHRDRGDDVAAGALIGGVVGLAAGAAIASGGRDRYYGYDRGYYGPRYRGYYGPRHRGYYAPRHRGFYGPPRYRGWRGDWRGPRCVSRRVYDPYIGRRVRTRIC